MSIGAVYRNLARALDAFAVEVRPWDGDATVSALDRHLEGLDVVFCDAYGQSFALLERRLAANLSWRAVVLAHGNMPKGGDPLFTRAPHLLRPGDGIVFTSEADRSIWGLLVEEHELVESVVPLAVDEATFRPERGPADEHIRTRFGLPPGLPLLLFVGRHNIQKNLHGLLNVLHEVHQSRPDVQLAFVGERDDIKLAEFQVDNTGYVEHLHTEASRLGVAAAVHFCGPAFGDDLAALYRTADLVVNLGFYHRENFGLSQAEAQACGTPVVCSAWAGFRDVVTHGETGILVEAVMTRHGIRVNWADAADAVVGLLNHAPRRDRMAAASAAHARAHFSIATFSQRLKTTVDEVLKTPVGSGPALRPSRLAERYFTHATDHGWSDPNADGWEPPMYGGDDYDIYASLLGPYASASAADLDPASIDPRSRPYPASGWALDHDRHSITDLDPVWPHRRFLSHVDWMRTTLIDGARTVGEIASAARATLNDTRLLLSRLHHEGFVLFRHDVLTSETPPSERRT